MGNVPRKINLFRKERAIQQALKAVLDAQEAARKVKETRMIRRRIIQPIQEVKKSVAEILRWLSSQPPSTVSIGTGILAQRKNKVDPFQAAQTALSFLEKIERNENTERVRHPSEDQASLIAQVVLLEAVVEIAKQVRNDKESSQEIAETNEHLIPVFSKSENALSLLEESMGVSTMKFLNDPSKVMATLEQSRTVQFIWTTFIAAILKAAQTAKIDQASLETPKDVDCLRTIFHRAKNTLNPAESGRRFDLSRLLTQIIQIMQWYNGPLTTSSDWEVSEIPEHSQKSILTISSNDMILGNKEIVKTVRHLLSKEKDRTELAHHLHEVDMEKQPYVKPLVILETAIAKEVDEKIKLALQAIYTAKGTIARFPKVAGMEVTDTDEMKRWNEICTKLENAGRNWATARNTVKDTIDGITCKMIPQIHEMAAGIQRLAQLDKSLHGYSYLEARKDKIISAAIQAHLLYPEEMKRVFLETWFAYTEACDLVKLTKDLETAFAEATQLFENVVEDLRREEASTKREIEEVAQLSKGVVVADLRKEAEDTRKETEEVPNTETS
jgi:hypothetical protein